MNDEDIKGVKPILHEWPTAHGLIRIVRVPGATWPSCETLDVDAGQWRACHPMEFMLTEEIVDLKKEIAVLRDGIDDWHKEADDRAREIIQQDAEITALREDAERYRWLRSRGGLTIRPDGGWWTREDGTRFFSPYLLRADEVQCSGEESLDAAIDAARRALEER